MGDAAKKTRNVRPGIYKYHDYRAYLKDLLSFYRAKADGPSLRDLAKASQVSPGFLSLVLNGHKALTLKVMEDLLLHLELSDDEKSYFRLLRTIIDSDRVEERLEAFNDLQKFKRYRKLNPQETEAFRYLTKWYYVAIREMVRLPNFQLNAEWIQENLVYPLSIKEIEKTISFLTKHKFIEVDANGKATLSDKNVYCEGGVYRMALGQFYRQIYSLASQSIEVTPREDRCILGDTVAIPQESFHEFKKILEDCLKKIVKLENTKSETDAVYHIGFMGFPLARKRKAA